MPSRTTLLRRIATEDRYRVEYGTVVSQSSSTFPAEVFYETFAQTSQPGNRKDPTSYAFSKFTRVSDFGFSHTRLMYGAAYDDIQVRGPQSIPVGDIGVDSYLVDTAYNNALSSMNDQLRGNLDLSVDIAQAGEVTKMLKDTVKLVRSFRAMPKELMKRAAKAYARSGPKGVARAIGGKWLEYQYGWRPLMQSVYDTAHKVIESPDRLLVIRGRGNASTEKKGRVYPIGNDSSGPGLDVTSHVSARCEFKCHFLPPSLAQTVSEFTSLNPATLAWELVPYSFVVDWFVDIGGYMRNVETACLNASAFQSGYVTTTKLGESSARFSGQFNYPDGGYILREGGSSERQVSLSRSVLTSFPLPRVPRFSMDLGSGRLLNAAALLSQHLRR